VQFCEEFPGAEMSIHIGDDLGHAALKGAGSEGVGKVGKCGVTWEVWGQAYTL